MARQSSVLKFEGQMDDMSFVKTKTGYRVRKKGGISASRFATDPAYARLREHNQEFGRAGKAGKIIRDALRAQTKQASDDKLVPRLTSLMLEVIKADAVSVRGQRNILDGELEMLVGNNAATMLNLFSKIAGRDTGAVTLKVSNVNDAGALPVEYNFAKPDALSNHRTPAIQLANKVKGFLDYKSVLETYFGKTRLGQNPNLFPLIVEELLADHLINRAGGGVATYPLRDEWERLYKPFYQKDRRYKAHRDAVAELPAFERILRALLVEVFSVFRHFISEYFDPKLDIDVTLSNMTVDYRQWGIKEELFLNITYAGQTIESYETFLNEARLSAIGISIYLAALKTYPPTTTDLKVLFLDDVFIGLDTNNRLPLLRIIKNEFINQGFQVFISTYDRNWFETAKYWFDQKLCSFKSIELFMDDNDSPSAPDYPVVIDLSRNYYEKALAYFKVKDYPASGNFLRKEYERVLKDLLFGKYALMADPVTGEVSMITELGSLWTRFYSANDCLLNFLGFEKSIYSEFGVVSKAVLNPLSHDNLAKPIYRSELKVAIELVDKLRAIEKVCLLKRNSLLWLETNNAGVTRKTFVELLEDVYVYRHIYDKDGAFHIETNITPCFVKPVKYVEGAIIKAIGHLRDCLLDKAFDMIYYDVFGITTASKLPGFNLMSEFVDDQSKSTIQYLVDNF